MKTRVFFAWVLVLCLLLPGSILAQQYAKQVQTALIGGANNKNTTISYVLGAPNSPKPSVRNEQNKAYVSLGGGFVIVDMGVTIFDGEGPDLKVYEVGGSYGNAGNEAFYVKGSLSGAPGTWVFLGDYGGDDCTIDLRNFGGKSVRYIAIFDKPYKGDDSSETPGADIDAVEALNYK